MHPKFAERIAKQLYLRKWKLGWKAPALAKWLQERFPTMTAEDGQQVKDNIPPGFHGTQPPTKA